MEIKDFFKEILNLASENKYPDIHLTTWNLPILRSHKWELFPVKELAWEPTKELTRTEIQEIMKIIAWTEGLLKFKKDKELDVSIAQENWDRYRVNCYMDTAGFSIALRIIPSDIPTMDDLWLWDQIKAMCGKSKGLILMTWPTGSWKSTNLAAMIEYMNVNFKKHIITIEDPVEFAFKSKNCLINQREIWTNTNWFAEAIRASLREDPDIIMVWEMRDPETIKAAITLAETGHLVLSTLHTNDSVQTIDRIVDVFPTSQQKQIRMQLAMSLVWVISQRLLPKKDEDARVAAREILIANDATKNLIIQWKTHQLYSVLEVSRSDWMILMDKYLSILYEKWLITKDTLLSFARDREGLEMLLD